ncbi:MAG: ATP-binding protein [Candidatus Dormibacteria bacterium]
MSAEVVKLRIGNLAKAVLVTGQSYQDPKDALNEFVSNAADEYAQMGRRGERIRILLRRQGRYPFVAISDDGRGLTSDRLREVAQNLFESVKAGDRRTLGEKAIGLLAFQQMGERCDIVSRVEGSSESVVLRLRRGKATATLDVEQRRPRDRPGTTVYVAALDPEVSRMLTQRKVVDYLRRRRTTALARGEYVIEVSSGRTVERVTPEKAAGVQLEIPPRDTLWGLIEFSLHVTPRPDAQRRVAAVGRAGTTIVDSITELEEFDHAPWNSGQVGGEIIFEALEQTAGRRAILRDREAFPLLVDAVASVEPAVLRAAERLAREVDVSNASRVSDEVRRIFARVLRELADLENPMRTLVGQEEGDDGLFATVGVPGSAIEGAEDREQSREFDGAEGLPSWPAADAGSVAPPLSAPTDSSRTAAAQRTRHLPTLLPDPQPGRGRSRFDVDEGIVYFNDTHADYQMVKDNEPALVDYLTTLAAKEYVVYNNPRALPDDLGEEMVRMLVRLRRHLRRA